MPQLSASAPTRSGLARSAISSTSSGRPGAGYCTSNSACGKPKKSWMVRGRGIAVTASTLVYQCAEIARIARGRGTEAPKARQASV